MKTISDMIKEKGARRVLLTLAVIAALAALLVFSSCGRGGNGEATGTEGTSAETKADPYASLPATPAEIDELIGSIGTATVERTADIDRAFYAYCQLSESDREAVTKLADLQALRSDLQKQYVVKEYDNTRVKHEKFLLGMCVVYHTDDETMRLLTEAGIDFVWPATVTAESMAQFEKYGIGVIASMGQAGLPGWPGQDATEDVVRMTINPLAFVDYPALWGFDLGDEPSAGMFESLGVLARVCHEYRPELMVYCNLFPNYASVSAQLGMYYNNYINKFVKNVDSDVICFDHYYEAQTLSDTIEQMRIVSEAAAKDGRDFWDILQLNRSHEEYPVITADMMRYQAYLSMAYGCKSVMWACWENAWWYGNVLDAQGNVTEVYDLVKEVDAELEAIEPIYMRYSGSSAALLLGNNATVRDGIDTWIDKSLQAELRNYTRSHGFKKLRSATLSELNGSDDSFVIAGYLKKNVGEGEAFLFVNSTDKLFMSEDLKPATVTFKTTEPDAIVVSYVKGVPTRLEPVDGTYTVDVAGADAVLVTID